MEFLEESLTTISGYLYYFIANYISLSISSSICLLTFKLKYNIVPVNNPLSADNCEILNKLRPLVYAW